MPVFPLYCFQALMAQKRDFEAKLKQQKDELTEKLEASQSELRNKISDYNKLQRERDDLASELNKKMREFALTLDMQSGWVLFMYLIPFI
jgi:hypothetical protein